MLIHNDNSAIDFVKEQELTSGVCNDLRSAGICWIGHDMDGLSNVRGNS